MKKTILFLTSCLTFIFCGCTLNNTHTDTEVLNDKINVRGDAGRYGYCIIELTYEGETHEYIQNAGYNMYGLSHWEGCKYCKKHN